MNGSPPFTAPVVVTPAGNAIVPYPFADGVSATVLVCTGVSLGWVPWPTGDAILLSIWGGTPQTRPSEHNVTATLSRNGLRALIADLQAIDAQLGTQIGEPS